MINLGNIPHHGGAPVASLATRETCAVLGHGLRLGFILRFRRIRKRSTPLAIQVHHTDKIRLSDIGVVRIGARNGVLDVCADLTKCVFGSAGTCETYRPDRALPSESPRASGQNLFIEGHHGCRKEIHLTSSPRLKPGIPTLTSRVSCFIAPPLLRAFAVRPREGAPQAHRACPALYSAPQQRSVGYCSPPTHPDHGAAHRWGNPTDGPPA